MIIKEVNDFLESFIADDLENNAEILLHIEKLINIGVMYRKYYYSEACEKKYGLDIYGITRVGINMIAAFRPSKFVILASRLKMLGYLPIASYTGSDVYRVPTSQLAQVFENTGFKRYTRLVYTTKNPDLDQAYSFIFL